MGRLPTKMSAAMRARLSAIDCDEIGKRIRAGANVDIFEVADAVAKLQVLEGLKYFQIRQRLGLVTRNDGYVSKLWFAAQVADNARETCIEGNLTLEDIRIIANAPKDDQLRRATCLVAAKRKSPFGRK